MHAYRHIFFSIPFQIRPLNPNEKENESNDTFLVQQNNKEGPPVDPKTRHGSRKPMTSRNRNAPVIKAGGALVLKPRKSVSKVPAPPMPMVKHPNPTGSRNLYYDEKWVQKQEAGFQKWLNFILTPDHLDEEDDTFAPGKIDVAKLWKACSANVKVPRAPTKEVRWQILYLPTYKYVPILIRSLK